MKRVVAALANVITKLEGITINSLIYPVYLYGNEKRNRCLGALL